MIASPPSRESLLRAARNLSAAPMILARLGRMVTDVDTPLEQITEILKCDTALTTRVMRIANSVAYSAGDPCASLDEAVLRVGFSEIYRLTGFAATTQIIEHRLGFYGVTAAQFRENALLTALIVEQLAAPADVDRPTAYTVGLLRSIGKIALDRWGSTNGANQDYEANGNGPLADWETANVGMNNGEAAEVIMKEWLFPAATIEAIRDHYQPSEDSKMATLLNLAAGAAERCGHGWPGERFYWNPTHEQYAVAGVTPDQVDAATRVALESFGPVRAAVG
jgi:HD-like signal output (HDOD) protein